MTLHYSFIETPVSVMRAISYGEALCSSVAAKNPLSERVYAPAFAVSILNGW